MCDSDRIPREYKNVVEVAKTWRFVSFSQIGCRETCKMTGKNDDISKFTFISNDK